MALPHVIAGQPVPVQPLGPRLQDAKTSALFKSQDLELIHLVLLQGRSLPPHKVPGEITLHCLEGRLDVSVDGRSQLLGPGQLLFLQRNALYSVTALEDASGLVTIALRSGG
ncbi:MAG TPA: cupin domain-containing protein [Burkholderiaceae bacterium]|nr:cupin domain-containing protein [Burkholderiaceae bacterium]